MQRTGTIFATLCAGFLAYSCYIYMAPEFDAGLSLPSASRAAEGRLVWQKYNCQSCHQLYGLGGFLGPDLTNVTSAKGKNNSYILGMVRSGTSQMPAFELQENEEDALIEFLHAVDQTGTSDPRRFRILGSGMIEPL